MAAGAGGRRDEGNKGVLSSMRIENRVWVAIVVIMFAGIPFIPVDLSTIKFDTTRSAQCQVSVPQPADTGWSNVHHAQQPERAGAGVVVLHARHLEGRHRAAVAAIPWGPICVQIRMDVTPPASTTRCSAGGRGLLHDCYGPSRAKLFMDRPTLS